MCIYTYTDLQICPYDISGWTTYIYVIYDIYIHPIFMICI